jgi:spore maturation protein CgeB
MAQEGFAPVRIFDILASGGFCISEKNSGIKEIFGDTVPQYESAEHLKKLVDFYIKNPGGRLKLMERGKKIVLSHTWGKRAKQFLNTINEYYVTG